MKLSILEMASMLCQQYVKSQWKTSHFKHDTHDIDISVITNNQETLPNKFFYKNYNTCNAEMRNMKI